MSAGSWSLHLSNLGTKTEVSGAVYAQPQLVDLRHRRTDALMHMPIKRCRKYLTPSFSQPDPSALGIITLKVAQHLNFI